MQRKVYKSFDMGENMIIEAASKKSGNKKRPKKKGAPKRKGRTRPPIRRKK